MRISNLSNKSGNPSAGDYLVLDDGTTVTKIDYNKLAKAIIENYAASTLAGSAQSVKAALDSLNSKTAPTAISGITLAENEASATVRAYKMGRMCMISFMGTSTTHTHEQTLFTLPSGARPNVSWDIVAQKQLNAFTVRIKPDGTVQIWTDPSNVGSAGRIYFAVAFPTAN